MEILLPGLKARRKAAGMTQQELADATGLSVPTISKHEQGVTNGIDGATLTALSKALNCDRYQLFLPEISDMSEICGELQTG